MLFYFQLRGTSFVVAVVEDHPENIIDKRSIETRGPVETLEDVVSYFQEYSKSNGRNFDALGLASFGPIELHKDHPK